MARMIASALAAVALATTALGFSVERADAGTVVLKSCSAFGDPGAAVDIDGPVWQPQGPNGFGLVNRCSLGGSFQIANSGPASNGANAQWHTLTPPTIGITGALTPLNTVFVIPNPSFDGYVLSYFWNGGSQTITDKGNCCGGLDYGLGIDRNDLNGSRYFGFQVSCIHKSGCSLNGKTDVLDVKGIELTGQDNTPPSVQAIGYGNLWYETSRWVRGTWPASFEASDDSGVCGMRAIVDGESIQGPTAARNQSSWTQCPTPQTMNQSIDTTSYPDGPLSLLLSAADAASPANVSSPNETLHVDNSPITLGLGGPTDALSTAGVQYVDALASAGPSGVADIQCSVDSAPYVSYAGAGARIPVQGIGPHTVSCYAQNNSYDANLHPASSALESWHLSIRQPTIAAISFGTRLLDALRCHRVRVRVKLAARWVTIRRHGRPIRVHHRAHTITQQKIRCQPRVVIRKVRGHGHVKRKRIVLLPHTVQLTKERVGYGHAATVSGWVGLADGTALGGVPVQVITATDNGLGRWRLATVVSTNVDGLWRARLRAGPSRLIAAIYPGSGTTEPAISGHIHLIVPTQVTLRIRPRVARWGHTVTITGRVLGGYIPTGKLLRLRIGAVGVAFSATAGIPNINRHGYFHTRWSFGAGRGVVRYWFSVSTLPEADYPYAPSSSARVYVSVHG